MARILFWNLYGRQESNRERRAAAVCDSLTRLVQSHSIDVLLFAECLIAETQLQAAFDASGSGEYRCPTSRSRKVKLWSRLAPDRVIDRHCEMFGSELTIREVLFPGCDPILLAGVHLADRITLGTESGRALSAYAIAEAIRRTEADRGHSRTILIGDLNMNPYEAGVVGSHAFHGVMTKALADRMSDLAARKPYSCFYNPMWALFGDQSAGPPGTHYFDNSKEPTNHFWQLYDQLLIRPDLVARFVRVEILTGDGVNSFLTREGRPARHRLSDHLPILAEFEFGA